MCEAADAVGGYVARGCAVLGADSSIADALLSQVVVLSGAAKAALQADPSLAMQLSAVPWSSMTRVRDRAVPHDHTRDRDVLRAASRTAMAGAADDTAGHGPERRNARGSA